MQTIMRLEGSRVLVIGGAGFIGSHLVDQLLQEDVSSVVVYDNFVRGKIENLNKALKDPRVWINEVGGDITQVDILNDAMKGVDYVFHLAALWLLQCNEFPRSAFKVNVEGTFNVIEACERRRIKKLVYSSSASVYGDAVEIPMTEAHPLNNETFYGATKIAGEQMLKAYHKRYGLPYVGLRYMNVIGERQDYRGAYVAVIMRALDRILKGEPPVIYGDGMQTYDFIDVRDVARANICALNSPEVEGFYNVGTGVGTTIKELTQILLELSGVDLEPVYEPSGETFVTNRVGSIEAALDFLGFKAKIDLRTMLRDISEWRKHDAGTNH